MDLRMVAAEPFPLGLDAPPTAVDRGRLSTAARFLVKWIVPATIRSPSKGRGPDDGVEGAYERRSGAVDSRIEAAVFAMHVHVQVQVQVQAPMYMRVQAQAPVHVLSRHSVMSNKEEGY